jgi:hypothetical protein
MMFCKLIDLPPKHLEDVQTDPASGGHILNDLGSAQTNSQSKDKSEPGPELQNKFTPVYL